MSGSQYWQVLYSSCLDSMLIIQGKENEEKKDLRISFFYPLFKKNSVWLRSFMCMDSF